MWKDAAEGADGVMGCHLEWYVVSGGRRKVP